MELYREGKNGSLPRKFSRPGEECMTFPSLHRTRPSSGSRRPPPRRWGQGRTGVLQDSD